MKKLVFAALTILITLLVVSCTTLGGKPVVDIAFDLNGGFWSKEDIESIRNDANLTINEFVNYNGDNTKLTLFTPTDTGLRWHYKAFIQYNADLYAYMVVYSDPYTASVDRLDLPDYDYIIGVHYHNASIAASTALSALFSDGVGIPLIFDKDITEQQTTVNVKLYPSNPEPSAYQVKSNILDTLPIPVRPNYDFAGWYIDDVLIESRKDIKVSEGDTMKILTAKWASYSLESLDAFLDQHIPDHTTTHLTLPKVYSGYSITWHSTHPLVISTDGRYQSAYEPTTVTLTATIRTMENTELTRTYHVTVPHKKSLARPIASSYIWRNYNAVDDRFFETLDIINTAFLKADANGNFTVTTALNDIHTYIMPKAKQYGNWVVFSIAPESEWASIARNAANIENFANNIVDIINENGFDGVDVDWETPRQGEQVWYSNMIKVIHEKVKANNPSHLVTTAITGGMWQPPMYNLNVSNQYLDYINVMTYSMSSSSGSYQNALYNRSGFHNPEARVGQTPTSVSIDASVPIFNNYGVPNSKLIFGLAFYGVRQSRTYNTSTQTFSSWTALTPSVFFPEIQGAYLNNPDYTYYFDNEAGVPYILKNDGTLFISYDDERSIRLKSEYVIEQDLGGLMFWEYGTDTSGTLLSAMRSGLNK